MVNDPGWYPDPMGRFEVRYHDGAQWTAHVATGGVTYSDPIPAPQGFAGGQQPAPPPGLTATAPFTDGAPGGSGSGNTGPILAAVGLCVLGALLVGAFLLLRGDDEGAETVAGSSVSAAEGDDDVAVTTTEAPTTTPTTQPPTTRPPTTLTTLPPTTAPRVDPPSATDPRTEIPEYGTDPVLDALADDCQRGDFVACDDLFLDSPFGGGYEAYGDSCGGRNRPAGFCADIYAG